MAIERLMAMHIVDDAQYTLYREKMFPILQDHGGDFGYDFKVSEVLKSQTPEPINRVFTIHFPNKDKMERFFSNTEYLKIKEQYFESSVGAVTQIAIYEK